MRVRSVTGTLINIVAVLVGGTLGLLIGNRLAARTQQTVMSGIGLVTLVIGVQMALATRNILIVMFSVLLGGVLGEWWNIDGRLQAFGDWLQRCLAPGGEPAGDGRSVSQAFVTASLVFCVGPLTILGAIQDGLLSNFQLLAVKSILDGFAAMAFATTLGWGVLLSVITLLVYQGGISLVAMLAAGAWATSVSRDNPGIIELTATGGVLIMGISLLLLDVKRIRIANFLPAIALAPLFVIVLQHLTVR